MLIDLIVEDLMLETKENINRNPSLQIQFLLVQVHSL
jgi:hypothetical protein